MKVIIGIGIAYIFMYLLVNPAITKKTGATNNIITRCIEVASEFTSTASSHTLFQESCIESHNKMHNDGEKSYATNTVSEYGGYLESLPLDPVVLSDDTKSLISQSCNKTSKLVDTAYAIYLSNKNISKKEQINLFEKMSKSAVNKDSNLFESVNARLLLDSMKYFYRKNEHINKVRREINTSCRSFYTGFFSSLKR